VAHSQSSVGALDVWWEQELVLWTDLRKGTIKRTRITGNRHSKPLQLPSGNSSYLLPNPRRCILIQNKPRPVSPRNYELNPKSLSSLRGVTRLIILPAPRAGKMNQILRCDCLPERARWSYLSRSGLPAASRKKNFPESHIVNPLLTKLVRSRWWILASFCLGVFMDHYSVSVHKQAKTELGQYPAILTLTLVNNPYMWPKLLQR